MKLNNVSEEELQQTFSDCCGSEMWNNQLVELRPFRDLNDLIEKSNQVWYGLNHEDWKEAFSHHPRIGDIESLREKFGKHETWSKNEQSSVSTASEAVIQRLKQKNDEYFDKFGYIFIVFATGKSASEMLEILEERLVNTPESEIIIAAREQNKITRLRLSKLLS